MHVYIARETDCAANLNVNVTFVTHMSARGIRFETNQLQCRIIAVKKKSHLFPSLSSLLAHSLAISAP